MEGMRKWIKRLKLIKPNGKKGQCLTRRQLLGYAEGTLSEREEAHVERHMQECPPCERMATVFRRYAEMPDLDFEIEDLLEHPNFKRLLDAVESFDERPLGISQEMFKIIERRARVLRSSKALSQVREWVMKLMEAWRLATWAVSRRWLAAVLVAIVSIPALVVLMLMWPGKSNLEQGMLALTEAYRGHRPVEARLSGGFPHAPAPKRLEEKRDRGLEWLFYAPYEPPPRPGQTAAKEKVFNAAVTDKFLERDDGSLAARHLKGRAQVLDRDFQQAEQTLKELLKNDPDNAQLHNDLGVILLEQGRPAAALRYFDKAVALDGQLLEAVFNRALCHQRLMLLRAARQDWTRYLEMEKDPQWTAEARQHLAQLDALTKTNLSDERKRVQDEFIRAYEQQDHEKARRIAGEYAYWIDQLAVAKVIPEYLEHRQQRNQKAAEEKLRLAEYMGDLLATLKKDHLLADAVRVYKTMPPSMWDAHWAAYRLFKSREQFTAKGDYQKARQVVQDAARTFARLGDPFYSERAALFVADYLRLQGMYRECIAACHQILPQLKERSHKWHERFALIALAKGYNGLGNYSEALKYLRQAITLEEVDHLWGEVADMFNSVGVAQMRLGQPSLAINAYEQALQDGFGNARPILIETLYQNLAVAYMALNDYQMAAKYLDEALFRKEETPSTDPYYLSKTLTYTGQVFTELGNHEKAAHYLERARQVDQSITDPKRRQETEVFRLIRLGRLYRSLGNLGEAAKIFDQCRALLGQRQDYRLEVHFDIARTRLALGQFELAREEFDQAIQVFEENRALLYQERQKNAFLARGEDIYDDMVLLLYNHLGDKEAAFNYSERLKARTYLDLVANGARLLVDKEKAEVRLLGNAQPRRYAEIVAALPEDVSLLHYAVTREKTLVWLINRGLPPQTAEISVNAKDLRGMVEEFLDAIKQGAPLPQVRAQAQQLDTLLIGPVTPFLKPEKTLCIIPDDILHYLPFAALVSPATGHYFVQDYRLSTSPSASLFLHCLKLSQQKPQARTKFMGIGNPVFDSTGETPPLLHAEDEVREIARLYGTAQKLIGPEATEDAVLRLMPRYQAVHFATHIAIRETEPLFSGLALTRGRLVPTTPTAWGSSIGDGLLQMFELYDLKLPQTSLVVLSGCESGLGGFSEGEGIIGLTRPFMRAGVPTLVVSLWPVSDSRGTVDLMTEFHRRWRFGAQAAAALRDAQLLILSGDEEYRHPRYWAPFLVVGN
jgi:CHAT domain-containing protein/Flp pilus assembly protein TadD